MITQPLLDYIKQQLNRGVSKEQIKNSLVANGWQASDVEEGFSAIGVAPSVIPPFPAPAPRVQPAADFAKPAVSPPAFTEKKKSKVWGIVIFIIVMILVLAGFGWFMYKYFYVPKTNTQTETPPANQTTNQTPMPEANAPLDINQATLSSPQLTYPFSGITLNVTLKNNATEPINGYSFRFYLDGADYFDQVVGSDLASINPGATYEMSLPYMQSVISGLASSCDMFGLKAGAYSMHLKISTDTKTPLLSDTTGPLVTDQLIPFNLTTTCKKK